MVLAPSTVPLDELGSDCLCFGVFEGATDVPERLRGTPYAALLEGLLASGDFPAKCGDVTPILGATGFAGRPLMVFGAGRRDEISPGKAYLAGLALTKSVSKRPRTGIVIFPPEFGDDDALHDAFLEGLIVGTRGPGLRKTDADRHEIPSIRVVSTTADGVDERLATRFRRAQVVGEAVNLARELVNLPPAEKAPRVLAARAREVAAGAGLTVEVWDRDRIEAERFGGLLGVAAGSSQPPAFVVLDHKGGGDSPPIALVGKGITFDSGGLSLKPSASMEDMKSDMTGAAVVLAALVAAARLGVPVNARGYLALAENMTGGSAMKLGDVLTMRNGKTVEVLNTDAEGRLILADTLSYAAEHKPAAIVDLATLTGACMVALGTKVAGLFANDHDVAGALLAACRRTGERAWRLPLDADYQDGLKSHVADLKNIGGKWGGAITAAKFLEQFVGGTPWAHLDIAGPSWSDSDSATRDVGGTGCFVRTLVALMEQRAGQPGSGGDA